MSRQALLAELATAISWGVADDESTGMSQIELVRLLRKCRDRLILDSESVVDRLPRVLTFPASKQNSISVERALKLARDVIREHTIPDDSVEMTDAIRDRINTAIDDLELMIRAVRAP